MNTQTEHASEHLSTCSGFALDEATPVMSAVKSKEPENKKAKQIPGGRYFSIARPSYTK